MERVLAWNTYDEAKKQEVFAFSEDYKRFISVCKTERECVAETIRMAEAKGYRNLDTLVASNTPLKPRQVNDDIVIRVHADIIHHDTDHDLMQIKLAFQKARQKAPQCTGKRTG